MQAMASPVRNSYAELSIRAEGDEVRRASSWIERTCGELGVPMSEIRRLDVCLNEILANILAHGGDGALFALIDLQLEVNLTEAGSTAIVTVSDRGVAFDLVAAATPARAHSLAEVMPGGLGLLMIRNSVDSLGYRYSDGRNQVSFGVRWSRNGDA
jgi:anti-sigma regulatory factor (Ser/Thr protein kinase)